MASFKKEKTQFVVRMRRLSNEFEVNLYPMSANIPKMSNSARQLARVISRPVKKLQKPRPLKTTPNTSRHSSVEAANLNLFDEIMILAEAVATNLTNGNFDRNLQSNILSLSGLLKNCGPNLEVIFKDQLDRVFVIFRNGCRDENLDYTSRLHLLELIELRAMHWVTTDNTSYYKSKYNHPDVDILSLSSLDSFSLNSASSLQSANALNSLSSAVSQPLLLGPGEVIRSTGKFAAPTKIPGKNYCKDEVVIRNSDSGKVMGIKGRRVHMIEELSETVISFQRVNPGAKERLVQITGPSEDKITYAKQLIEETIKRNASPVRSDMLERGKHGSNSSLNSTLSEEDGLTESSIRTTLLHSFSTNDASIGEYKYTVTIGEDTLKITGTNPDLVTIAKLVLDEYFLSDSNDQLEESGFEDETNFYGRIYVPEQEEENLIKNDSVKRPLRVYTWEKLIFLSESPLSRKCPDDWARISKEFPAIVKKPPIDWFDSKTYMKERQQESDAAASSQTSVKTGSLDLI